MTPSAKLRKIAVVLAHQECPKCGGALDGPDCPSCGANYEQVVRCR